MVKKSHATLSAVTDPITDFHFAGFRTVFIGGFGNSGSWCLENKRQAGQSDRLNRDTGFRVSQTLSPVQRVDG